MWAKLKLSSSSNPKFSKLATGSGTEFAEEKLPMAMAQRQLSKKPSLLKMVDEEYSEALHTKSYTEMYSRVLDHQLELKRSSSSSVTAPTNIEQEEEIKKKKLQHTQSSLPSYHSSGDDHIPDFLLEPSQESLLAATSRTSTTSTRSLLLDFFDATLQASTACAALLSSINHARSHNRNIHSLLLSLSSTSSPSTYSQLSSHLELDNPLSPQNLSRFHLIHSRYPTLIRRLTSAHRKITRRLKFLQFTKNAAGVAVIVLLGATVAAAAVIASHGAAAVAVALVATMVGGTGNWFRGWVGLEREKARVNAAAKGAYIVGRDLDTMSQMVRRVHDEVEHGWDVGRLMVRKREWEMVREVVKEMEGRGGEAGLGLEEQLEELEEHVYLCLIIINRSRRLVHREMVVES